jgi:hypothetical protein
MAWAALGVILASVALFLWGFLYWGLSHFPYQAWKRSSDDEAAQKALLELFPEDGTYYVPGRKHDAATLERLFRQGPLVFVHMLRRDGRPPLDPGIMIRGFALNVVVAALVALLLWQARGGLPDYLSRLLHASLAGVIASLMIDCGDAIWWEVSWVWKLRQAIYNCVAFVIGGAILAYFVTP